MTSDGRSRAHDVERVGAVGRLQRLVPAILEQRHHELAVRRVVVDDQDLGHAPLRYRSGQAGRARNPAGRSASISATNDSGVIGFDR